MKKMFIVACALILICVNGQGTDEIGLEIDGYLHEINAMVWGTRHNAVLGCKSINTSIIEYHYYNKENLNSPIKLNLTNIEDKVTHQLPTKLIFHGWYGSATNPKALAMKDAYLKRGNYNVIMVDWEKHASVNYPKAHCSIKPIGDAMGSFVHQLHEKAKISLKDVHLIGHSLGAHLAGHVGQRIQQLTGGQKLGRITGLDAAGPGFLGFAPRNRLDASDALFVDAIHTNGAQLGYPKNYGRADFYPNCGLFQPGCSDTNLRGPATLLQQSLEKLACSHSKSVLYFTESINSKTFLAEPFQRCYLLFWCSRYPNLSKVVMGEDCPRHAAGSYGMSINPRPPYARSRYQPVKCYP